MIQRSWGFVIFWCCLWCCSGSEFLHIIKWCTKRIIPTDTEVFLLKNGTNQPYLDILLEQLFRDICFCKLPWIERLGCHGYVDGILVFSTCLDVGNYWTIWTPNNNPIQGVSTPKKAQGGAIFADVWWFCFFSLRWVPNFWDTLIAHMTREVGKNVKIQFFQRDL